MTQEHSDAVSALSRSAGRAYKKVKDREAEVRTGGPPSGISKRGLENAVAIMTDVRSGVSEKTKAPWFSFTGVTVEDKEGSGEITAAGERFTILYFLGETEFSNEEEGIDNFVNDLKLLGYKKEVSFAKDLGEAVRKILPVLKDTKPYFLFNTSRRANKEGVFRCFIAGKPANGYSAPGSELEVEREPEDSNEDDNTPFSPEKDFAEGDRCAVDFYGTLYDGTITQIDESKGIAHVEFDDDTEADVEISDLAPPTDS